MILDEDRALTGRQLCALIGRLERRFIEAGIGTGDRVPCIVSASIESVAAIYALGMIGAAYVPVSPRVPRARQAYIIDDMQARTVVTDRPYLLVGADVRYILLQHDDTDAAGDGTAMDEEPQPVLLPRDDQDVAYCIYTSGSTGTPKGVMVSFANLQTFLDTLQTVFPVREGDRYLLSGDLQFAVAVSELFGWIEGGGSLVVLNQDEQRDIRRLPDRIMQAHATHVAASPAVVGTWTDRQIRDFADGDLTYLMIAGAEFTAALARHLSPLLPCKSVYNCYGQTEHTLYATVHRVTGEDVERGVVPIGRPLPGVTAALESGGESPYAELVLSGGQVALGYHGLPERTARSFRMLDGGRSYATGDAVETDARGELVYRGRVDFQMEINGIRVEPGEIETAVLGGGDVQSCVVMMVDHVLTCWYVAAGEPPTRARLVSRVGALLPDYEVPQRWIALEEFPLTVNGKIDRDRLLELARERRATVTADGGDDAAHPLVEALRAGLGLPPFDARDDLFELGVDSLRAAQAESIIERHYGRRIPNGFLRAHPTVRAIEWAMEQADGRDGGESDGEARLVAMLARYGFHATITGEQGRRCLDVECDDVDERARLRYTVASMAGGDALARVQAIRVHGQALFDTGEPSTADVTFGAADLDASYESSIFQKVYSAIRMDSFLDSSFTIDHDADGTRTRRVIDAMIARIEALRTTLHWRDDGTLASLVHGTARVEAHIRDLTLLPPDVQRDAMEGDIAQARRDMLADLFDHPLYRVLAFRTRACTSVVHVVCHHAIADGASVDILRQLAQRLIDGEPVDPLPRMRDYLAALEPGSAVEDLLAHPHTRMLAALPDEARCVRPGRIFGDDPHVVHGAGGLGNEACMMAAADEITAHYLRHAGTTMVPFQMLFNFRTVGGRRFADLVNDCHETLTFVRDGQDDSLTFMNALYRHLTGFHYHDGHSTGYAIYRDFPDFPPARQRLRDIYESAPVNIDYIGAIAPEELESQIEKVRELGRALSGMKRQMRFTAFSCGDDLIIMQVSAR
ncbi:AMP-binding protein [Bifidobacterium samirii]|uniref:AMP-binding protein n=1 Tax=Bifidobacterium samirii TaxID=2306974 RepID=UPI0013E07369|nr:AMP-binding protein [Bifidobacterium samirii]